MNQFGKSYLLLFFLQMFFLQTMASDGLSELCRIASGEKSLQGYSAVCRYLYEREEQPQLLELYADSIRLLGEAGNSTDCFIEYYAWKSEAAFIRGDFNVGYALKRQAIALAERIGNAHYISDCASDMGYYFNVDARYDSARYYFRKGMAVSERVPELAAAYRVMLTNYASSFLYEGETDSALVYARQALLRSEADKDTALLIENYNQLGTIYRRKKDLEGVIRNFRQALLLCEAQNNYNTAAYIYGNIATAYCDWNRAADAIPFSKKAVEYAERLGNRQMMGVCYVNLGGIQTNYGPQLDEGIATLKKAVSLLMEVNNRRRLCEAYSFLTNAYRLKGEQDTALVYLSQLDRLSSELKTDAELYRYYRTKAPLLKETGQYAEAAGYFRQIVSMLEQGYRDTRDYDNYFALAECCQALGDSRQAYTYLHQAYALRDSASHAEYTRQLTDYSVKYQTKEKELEIVHLKQAQLEQKAKLLRRRFFWGALISSLLIVLLIMLYARQRQQMRLARLAQAVGEKERQFLELQRETGRRLTRKYIDGLESERQRIATELHDDVCNNLLALEMSVRLRSDADTENVKAPLNQLEQIRQRLRTMSHELMPPVFQYANIDEMLSDYVAHLALPDGMKADYVSTEKADWNHVPQEVAFEFYRIVQEAVGNALKYSAASLVRICLTLSGNELSLQVSDSGKGFEVNKRTQGAGLRTIRQRAGAIKAQVDITSSPGKGTTIAVVAKITPLVD